MDDVVDLYDSEFRLCYQGKIVKLRPNQIFVFGSNPEGRHGAGAAKFALRHCGARYGQGRGLQGQSYALPTKNLTSGYVEHITGRQPIVYPKSGLRSLTPSQIRANICDLYNVAQTNSALQFLIGYTTKTYRGGCYRNGYSPQEMADMFSSYPIPNNIIFNCEFARLLNQEVKAVTR